MLRLYDEQMKQIILHTQLFLFIQGLLIIGLIIYLWRKRKGGAGHKKNQYSQREHHTEHIDEPVEVDWDQLENKYVEMPSSKFNNSYPPSTNFNDEGTTLRGTEDTPIVSTTANFITVPDGSEIHKLNTAEAISQKQQPVMVLKPDGSGFH
jgi:hypothetical protein